MIVMFNAIKQSLCFAKSYDENKPTLMLNSHMDTVRPSDSWTFPPYQPTLLDGRIIGLGANDAHASLVSLITVFNVKRHRTIL